MIIPGTYSVIKLCTKLLFLVVRLSQNFVSEQLKDSRLLGCNSKSLKPRKLKLLLFVESLQKHYSFFPLKYKGIRFFPNSVVGFLKDISSLNFKLLSQKNSKVGAL